MASKKEIEDCSNCVHDGTHSNLCNSCDTVVSNFKAADIVNCCENCNQLQAELDEQAKRIDVLEGALENCKETIAYVKTYVENSGLSAADDCDESLEIIKQALTNNAVRKDGKDGKEEKKVHGGK